MTYQSVRSGNTQLPLLLSLSPSYPLFSVKRPQTPPWICSLNLINVQADTLPPPPPSPVVAMELPYTWLQLPPCPVGILPAQGCGFYIISRSFLCRLLVCSRHEMSLRVEYKKKYGSTVTFLCPLWCRRGQTRLDRDLVCYLQH